MLGPDLTLIDKKEDPVSSDRAVGEENRVELNVGAAKIEEPEKNVSYWNHNHNNIRTCPSKCLSQVYTSVFQPFFASRHS